MALRREHQRLLAATVSLLSCAATCARADKVFCDLHKPDDPSFVFTQLSGAQRTPDGLVMQTTTPGENVAVKLRPAEGAWDASNYSRIVLDIENRSDSPAQIRVRVLNPGGNDFLDSATAQGFIPAFKRASFNVYFYRKEEDLNLFPALKVFKGMRCLPGGFQTHWRTINPGDLRAIDLEIVADAKPQILVLHGISASSPVVSDILREKGEKFFPFVDKWGQYRWADWPEKVKSDADLVAAYNLEIDDLKKNPPLADRDEYGGYIGSGPKLNPATFFRVARVEDRWWLVDPLGNLFWSHGANSVGTDSASTVVTGRANYFADLPPRDSLFAAAWARENDGDERFDHLKSNLIRQLGPNFAQTMIGLDNDRMQSWGLNTIGGWSSPAVIAQHRVPYTMSVHPAWPSVKRGVPDVYAPDFEKRMADGVAKAVGTAAGDPWCIGFFIDNELLWEMNPLEFISSLLASRPDAFTKRQFIAQLRAQNSDIAALNKQLGTSYENWDAMEKSQQKLRPEQLEQSEPIRTLSLAFYADVAARYFRSASSAIHAAAPGQLYLGCRMHVQNKLLVEVAAKYCDVLSFNRYENSVADFDALGADLPVLISEFHFGALDAGMLGTGLRPASDRYDRSAKYVDYVEGALHNPRIIGTHWFAYCPQSITGREDGENFNTGLFDVCNQPYPEMRSALRIVAKAMYPLRLGK